MEMQLKELLERINAEGVQSAERKAQEITRDAARRAEEIVAQASREAADLVARARSEAAAFESSGKEALKQAGRDLILKVRQQILDLFQSIVSHQTSEALGPRVVEESIVSLVRAWSQQGTTDVEVLIPAAQGEKLRKVLLAQLAEEVRKGVQIELLPGLGAGFRVAEKGGSAYYDFTPEGISEFLFRYLSPRLSSILQEALAKGSD